MAHNANQRIPGNFSLPYLARFGCALLMLADANFASAAGATNTSYVVSGTTITAGDCSYEAVNPALAAAVSMNIPGMTVVIPSGTCAWGANQLKVPGGIALKGAGRDLTIIQRTAAVDANTYLVKFECQYGGRATFSDMTLVGTNPSLSQDRGLGIIGTCVDFKVARSKFIHFAFAGIQIQGGPTQSGVIYSNQFINNYSPALSTDGYGVVIYGDGTWPALKLGVEKDLDVTYPSSVFVEENYMSGNRHHIAANNGARYVFRYNTAIATDSTKNFPQVDAHGYGGQSWSKVGTRSWEVYKNKFSAQLSSGGSIAIGMRGGDGVIFDNIYGDHITRPIQLSVENQVIDYNDPSQNCKPYPARVMYNITDAYISESSVPNLVTNLCPDHIRLNGEYRFGMRPGYTAYVFPHPLRAN